MTWFYNLVIGLGGLIIAMLTFADEIAIKIKYFRNLKSLLFKIPLLILGTFMIIWASIQKDNDSDELSKKEKQFHETEIIKLNDNYKGEMKTRDSLSEKRIQNALDSSYAKSIKASNEALAKYNLMLTDSLHQVASLLNGKTSLAQLAIDAVVGDKPPIYTHKTNDGIELKFRYISANSTSYNVNINIYIVKFILSDIYVYQYQLGGKTDDLFLVPDRNRTGSFLLDPAIPKNEELIIIFSGSFSRNNLGTELIPFRDAYIFNFKENKLIGKASINYSKVFNHLDKMKIPR